MGKKKQKSPERKHWDEVTEYLLSCSCCPLCKEKKSVVDDIINGVMNKLGYPNSPKQHVCLARGCIVNPDKPRKNCNFREEYYKKHGMRPMGLLDGIQEPNSSILCRSPS